MIKKTIHKTKVKSNLKKKKKKIKYTAKKS